MYFLFDVVYLNLRIVCLLFFSNLGFCLVVRLSHVLQLHPLIVDALEETLSFTIMPLGRRIFSCH